MDGKIVIKKKISPSLNSAFYISNQIKEAFPESLLKVEKKDFYY